ncbi:hypothetical protein BY458DRAFT_505572 [Sporodiniella umbellata]|nr:hypothetical protein BY458DRAFT_505572 [Sporodiniella umbellata]
MQQYDWKDLFGEDELEVASIPKIPGLKHVKKALTHEQQMIMINDIIKGGYFSSSENINQAMCFGKLPSFVEPIRSVCNELCSSLFSQEILDRHPIFDQAILNLYQKGEGIVSHVDLLRFEDGILIVSLLSSCVMTMRPASKTSQSYEKTIYDKDDNRFDILLRPGDILALSGDARYKWEHGIEEKTADMINGEYIERGTRVSVTLRKLKGEDGQGQSTVTTTTR